jgi:hypothetical protein
MGINEGIDGERERIGERVDLVSVRLCCLICLGSVNSNLRSSLRCFLNPSISVSVERRFLVLPRRLGDALREH